MANIVDDRHRPFQLVTFQAGSCPHPDHPETRAMLARIRDDVLGDSRGCLRVLLAIAATPFILFLGGVAIGFVGWATRSPPLSILAGPVVIGCLFFLLVMVLRRNIDEALVNRLLWVGRCPACCQDIGFAPRTDGFVVCPECGAAWRAERIREIAVPSADSIGAHRLTALLRVIRAPHLRVRDARRRFTRPAVPRRRWCDASLIGVRLRPAWFRFLWIAIAVFVIIPVALFAAAITAAIKLKNPAPLISLPIFFTATAIFSAFVLPQILIGLLTRRGLCAACCNFLHATGPDRGECAACGAAWRVPSAVASRLPPVPPPALGEPSSRDSTFPPPIDARTSAEIARPS